MEQQWVHIPLLPGTNGAGPDQDSPTPPRSLTEGKYPFLRVRLLLCTTLINQIFLQEKSKCTSISLSALVGLPVEEG